MVPGCTVISIVAVLLSVWLLSNSTYYEARDATIAAVIGLEIYLIYKLYKRRAVDRENKSDS